jgi:cell division septation protein DedD
LVHEGELSGEKYRALQGTVSSEAQALHVPPPAQVLQDILGLGAGGAIQGIFAVQVGAFRDRSNAERLKERIESQFRPVVIQDFEGGGGLFYRVRVGNANTEDAARELAERLRKANLATETFAVRLK